MDSFTFQDDVRTISVNAENFPADICDAHAKLHSLLPANDRRRYFGVSWPGKDGKITYKAIAEEMEPEEAEMLGLETFTIKNGPYNSFYIKDFRDDPHSIQRAFELLTGQHEVDPDGYCLEWYINDKDVKCMVPLGKKYAPYTGLNEE